MTQTEPRVSCGAAIIRDGHILLLLRRTEPEAGAWGLPGGKVDLFEPAARACEREIAEELAITIVADDLLCHADHIDAGRGLHWVAPIYLVTRFAGTPTLTEPEKHAGLDWFPLDALPTPLTVPTHAAVAAWRRRTASRPDRRRRARRHRPCMHLPCGRREAAPGQGAVG